MGAVLGGGYPIIVVDVVRDRLAAAAELGATYVVDASVEDVPAAFARACSEGVELDPPGPPPRMSTAQLADRRLHLRLCLRRRGMRPA